MSLIGLGQKRTGKPMRPETSLRVQTSLVGRPIPLSLGGQFACAPNLLWYGNFDAQKVQQGGKGFGVGGGKAGVTSFKYSAAVVCGICAGPVAEIIQVWNGPTPQTLSSLNLTPFLGGYDQAAWGYLSGANQPIQEWHLVPSSPGPYTVQVNYHSPFIKDYGVIDSTGQNYKKVDSGLDINEYELNASTGTYTFDVQNAGAYVAISYTAGNQPNQALTYRGIACANSGPMQLGQSPELPNMRFEILHPINNAIPNLPDADPKDSVTIYLTDPHVGIGFPADQLNELSIYSGYCRAAGLVVSPILVDQQSGNSFLDDLMLATNSELVWNGSVLTAVPYGDTDLAANGATYTAPAAPLFLLTDTDFHPSGSGAANTTDPIPGTRASVKTQYNVVKVEILDRGTGYNPLVLEAKDDAAINTYGLRVQDAKQFHFFCDPNAGLMSAHLLLGRQQVRNQYTFTLGPEYIVLDPMDIVALSDIEALTGTYMGLNDQWVRIIEITENANASLTFLVEEYLNGTGAAPLYQYEGRSGWQINRNLPPPPMNTPIILAMPYEQVQQLQIGLGTSGPSGYGGCDVYISSDTITYQEMGRITGSCRQGLLTASFPLGNDPDQVNDLFVDLTESEGTLISGTQQDADLDHTLCYVGLPDGSGELIAFSTVNETTSFNYTLTDYIRRGQYGTTVQSHASGESFLRVDDSVFTIVYSKNQIGQTIYVKLTAFNVYEGGEQTLDEVDPITIVLPGIPLPPDVQGFFAQQQGNVVVFSWLAVTDPALKGYDIGFATQGTTNWDDFTLLTEAAAGTEMTNASVKPGNWTFGIRARDIADQLSPDISTYDLVVVNNSDTLIDYEADPYWQIGIGPSSAVDFIHHWTGVLVPSSSGNNAAQGWDVFDIYVPDVIATSIYATPTLDTGFDDTDRVFSDIGFHHGFGETTGLVPQFQIDTWLTGDTDPNNYIDWTIGEVFMRYIRGAAKFSNVQGQVCYLKKFEVIVDAAPLIEHADNVVVAPGGTAVTFPIPYHTAPFVFCQAIGTGGLNAEPSSITTTGFQIDIYDNTGTSVGGNANWQSQGT
jgi:hypothetical protein